jgi:hypothetical protein
MKEIAKAMSSCRVGNSPHRGNGLLAAPRHRQVQFSLEAPMPGPVHCAMCDMPEERCACEKYCIICKGQHNVRMGADGLYYCPDCREACDVPLANARGR